MNTPGDPATLVALASPAAAGHGKQQWCQRSEQRQREAMRKLWLQQKTAASSPAPSLLTLPGCGALGSLLLGCVAARLELGAGGTLQQTGQEQQRRQRVGSSRAKMVYACGNLCSRACCQWLPPLAWMPKA